MVVVEGTQALERPTRGTQSEIAANDLDDVVGLFDLLDQDDRRLPRATLSCSVRVSSVFRLRREDRGHAVLGQ